MVCCVFQATNLVNNYRPRKSARTFVSKQEASNKLYTVLANVISSDFKGIEINSELKNGYCEKELFDIIYSFKSLNPDERTLLH